MPEPMNPAPNTPTVSTGEGSEVIRALGYQICGYPTIVLQINELGPAGVASLPPGCQNRSASIRSRRPVASGASIGVRRSVPPMMAVTSLMRVQQILLARLNDALAPYELTFARYEALMLLYLSRAGSLPLGKMGARLQVHPTSVTNLIDGLEQLGYALREPASRATAGRRSPRSPIGGVKWRCRQPRRSTRCGSAPTRSSRPSSRPLPTSCVACAWPRAISGRSNVRGSAQPSNAPFENSLTSDYCHSYNLKA